MIPRFVRRHDAALERHVLRSIDGQPLSEILRTLRLVAVYEPSARNQIPAEIIVGILGVETIYGRDTGRFRVVDVLTTKAVRAARARPPTIHPRVHQSWITTICPSGACCRAGRR